MWGRWRLVLVVTALLFMAYVAVRQAYRLRSSYEPSPAEVSELRASGKAAIASGDVPVAALLLNHGSIIGRGYNTVLRDGNAGGHAEVNAVSDAIRSLGWERFQALDREGLMVVSTFEPCGMCKGMLLEYRIKEVAFIEPKSLGHWIREDLRALGYELKKRTSGPEQLQDSLFRLHPKYDPATADH